MTLTPLSQAPVLQSESSIKDALALFEGSTCSTIFVLANDGTLLGTITDGDLRRSLLNNLGLDTPLHSVMNRSFKSVHIHSEVSKAILLSKTEGLSDIPLIDDDRRICSVYTSRTSKVFDVPVVIMAGGKGQRLKPLTETCPKPMIPINGKPMLEIILQQFLAIGASRFYISVNYLKEQIIGYFGDGSRYNASITYLEENRPLGTAGSLSLLPRDLDSDFLVINCDVLSLISFSSLYDFFISQDSDALMCIRPYSLDLPFGAVNCDSHKLIGIEEKPSLSFMVNTGIYMFSSNILKYVPPTFLDMPDLFRLALKNGMNTHVYPLHEHWVDVGRHSSLDEASQTSWIS